MTSDPFEPGPRLVVGLAGTWLEGLLVQALQDMGVQVERCLVGDALPVAVADAPTSGVIVEETLNRLTPDIVADLAHAGLAVFVLAPESRRAEWEALGATSLPLNTPPTEIVAHALAGARRAPSARFDASGRHGGVDHRPSGQPGTAQDADKEAKLIAVAAADGGVGCTTLSINLAAALGAVAETVLLDGDFSHPCIAAYLAADVLRSLVVLTREVPSDTEGWSRALDAELQQLDPRIPRARLLLGVAKPELAPSITPRLLEDALAALRQRARYIILDLGGGHLGVNHPAGRIGLACADEVLLVARGDAVSLWQARTAAERWRRELELAEERLALVVNRHDRRVHQTRQSISWATGLPVAALIPEDHRQAQLAIAAQRPLLFQSRSRAAEALLDLADRVHGGQIVLPRATDSAARRWRLPWRRPPGRLGTEVADGAPVISG